MATTKLPFNKHHLYTVEQISKIQNISKRTVYRWIEDGLKPISKQKPFLFRGIDIINYLQKKDRERKRPPCKPGQILCPKCGVPRYSLPTYIEYEETGKILGEYTVQIIIKGICEKCYSKMCKFSSDKKIEKINSISLTEILYQNQNSFLNRRRKPPIQKHKIDESIPEQLTIFTWIENNCVNVNTEGGQNCE